MSTDNEYEVMVSQCYVWVKTIKAESQELADEIADEEWSEGEFTDEGSPLGWKEVRSVSGEYEII
tara:strand:- start:5622 stop:5816 length:195 start_codon:yes stop_codon:yes gene_type:complete